ncbi:MAG: hypothetical protein QXJ21_03360 [Thermofilum sp.]
MEAALLEQKSRRELLDYILASGSRTREKIAEAERLLSAIKGKVESEPVLKELLGNVAETLWVPDPPLPSSAEEVGRRLEDYEKQLDGLIVKLRAILEAVEHVGKLAPRVRELESRLSSWAAALRDVNPPLYSELSRFASRSSRVLSGLSALNLDKAADVLSSLVKEGEQLEARARAEYSKAVRLMLSELEAVQELIHKALHVVMPHERLELEESEKKLLEIARELSSAKLTPVPLNPPQVYAELGRVKKLASEKLAGALSPLEARVLEAYSRLASSAEARLFMLHEVVELVSRRAETSLPETLSALYELSRKGLIKLFAKLA